MEYLFCGNFMTYGGYSTNPPWHYFISLRFQCLDIFSLTIYFSSLLGIIGSANPSTFFYMDSSANKFKIFRKLGLAFKGKVRQSCMILWQVMLGLFIFLSCKFFVDLSGTRYIFLLIIKFRVWAWRDCIWRGRRGNWHLLLAWCLRGYQIIKICAKET